MSVNHKQNIPVKYSEHPKEYMRLYAIKNREKVNALSNKWRANNKEKARDVVRRSQAKAYAANPEKYRKAAVGYYHKDIEKSRARNRASNKKRKSYFEIYTAANRDKIKARHAAHRRIEAYKASNRVLQATRRAIKKSATIGDKKQIERFYNSVRENLLVNCYYCGVIFNSKLAHVDHIIPLSKGGVHGVENFCIACAQCNLSKHDKLLGDWIPKIVECEVKL